MNTHPIICSECNKGNLVASEYSDEFQHNGQALRVEGLECYICDNCGADPVFADQIRRNHRRIADAKRYADGLLVGDEIRAIRTQFDLSQQEAAELFGGGVNAFSKYERGDVLQSVAMDRLLRATAFYPFLIEFLREEARIAAGASGRVEVARYQAGPSLDMRDKAYRSRSVGGAVVVVEGGLHWQRGRAA